MAYQISQLVVNFKYNEKWSTSVSEVHEKSIPFPTITICNYNRISKKVAKKYQMTNHIVEILFGHIPSSYPIASNVWNNSEYLKEYSEWRHNQSLNYTSIMDKMGMDCSETFLSYRPPGLGFGLNDFLNISEFCQGSKTHSVDPILTSEFGKCYQIRTLKNITQSGNIETVQSKVVLLLTMTLCNCVGITHGAEFILDSRSEDYLELARNNFLDEGFVLQLGIGTNNVVPGDWIGINTGQHTKIAMKIKRTFIDRGTVKKALFPPPCTLEPRLKVLEKGWFIS